VPQGLKLLLLAAEALPAPRPAPAPALALAQVLPEAEAEPAPLLLLGEDARVAEREKLPEEEGLREPQLLALPPARLGELWGEAVMGATVAEGSREGLELQEGPEEAVGSP
jgi:hypothetical protein